MPGLYQIQVEATAPNGDGSLLSQTIRVEAPAAPLVRDTGAARSVATGTPPVVPSPVLEPTPSPARPAPAPAVLDLADEMPPFPGGAAALKAYLAGQTQYPDLARERDIQGKVYVQFVVQPDGSLAAVRLARGIGFGCDEEALRLVRNMPRWVPGMQAGAPVAVRYTFPIIFQLQ